MYLEITDTQKQGPYRDESALLQSGVIHHHPSQIWLQETDYTLLNLYGDIILLSSAFFIGF